ncbi:hypothetical protein AB835_11880 [Candidatus Endobugula sertula]|uniref:Peptidase S9 prolyl oligopeptidase catalytic domain-containing protein n=1 Tax=Candidatus Endobugula sertula TaxID=62101 RepID=A0A1D2QMQ0_9GAMM|nr:hypothetical protein AB835_11880 [Candidatus Endobugula sertula]
MRLIKNPKADYVVAIETSRYQDMASILKIDNDGRVNRSAFVHHDDTVPSYYFGVNNEVCVFLVQVTEQGSMLYTLKGVECNLEHIENRFYTHKLTCHGETLKIQGMKKGSAIPSVIVFNGATKDITYQEHAYPSNTRIIQLRDFTIVSSASSTTEEKNISVLYFYGSYGRPVSLLDHPWVNTTNNKGIAINCYVLLMPGGGEYGPQWHRKGIRDKYKRQRQWIKQAIEYICSVKQEDEKLILETNSAGAIAAISYYRDGGCIDGMILNSPFLHLQSVLENQPAGLLDKQDQYEWKGVEKSDASLSLFTKSNCFAPILIFSGQHDTITPRKKILEWVISNQASNIQPIDIVDIASGGHGFNCDDRHIANCKKLDFIEDIFV